MKSKYELSVKDISFYHVVQPIMSLSTNSVYGYEVLLRSAEFNNPELLFNYAREHHQLIDMDIKSIFEFFQTLEADKLREKNVKIFINVFPSTFTHTSFNDLLQRLETFIDTSSGNIIFELNEAEKEMNLPKIKKVINEVRKEGYLIALDDIGKGGSSLKSLLEIEPDIAKVDKYFAKDLAESPKKQRALQLILRLLGGDTEVVVEGFESKADLETAKDLGVSLGQGFFLGKPKPIIDYIQIPI